MSKATVMAKLRRRYGRKARVGIQTRHYALSAAQKEDRWQRIKEAEDEQQRIKERRRELKGHQQRLIEAAQFVVDVEGDPFAVETLAAALADAKEDRALSDRWSKLYDDCKKLERGLHHDKYEAYHIPSDRMPFRHIIAGGWTLQELESKIE